MYNCYDCKKEIQVKNGEIKDGFQLKYKIGDKEIEIIKCKPCYDTDKSLRNHQQCEVYSRIVGYLRPVQQWNISKQSEYKDRVNYNFKNEKDNGKRKKGSGRLTGGQDKEASHKRGI